MEQSIDIKFIQIQQLLKETNRLLIIMFKQKYKTIHKTDWQDLAQFGEKFYSNHKNEGKLTKTQEKIIKSGNCNEWDISLLTQVLNFKEFYDKKLDSMLQEVRDIRNSQAHNSNFEIPETQFNIYFSILKEVIIYLEGDKNLIVNIKNLTLGGTNDSKHFSQKYSEIKEEGNKLFKQKNFIEAIKKYKEGLYIHGLAENDKSILYSNIATSYYELYEKEKLEEHIDESLRNSKMSISINPLSMKGYFRMGKIYEKKEKLDKSLLCFKKCYSLSPNNEEIKNSIANIICKQEERLRNAELFSDSHPNSYEEIREKTSKLLETRVGKNMSELIMNDKSYEEFLYKNTPGLKETWLAHKYRDGSDDIKQDFQRAATYYSKAVTLGNAEAAYNLGLFYKNGRGVQQNFSIALSLFEKAANSEPFINTGIDMSPVVGVAEAQHSLALHYWNGIYVQKDYKKAITFYEKAYENGSNASANNLGIIYLHGDYLQKDLNKAEKLFLYAYSKGNVQALPNLVEVYIALQNYDQALLWHKRGLENNCMFSSVRDKEIMNILSEMKNQEINYKTSPKLVFTLPRIDLIVNHRVNLNLMERLISKNFNHVIHTTYTPDKIKKNITQNYSKVYLRDIDSTKDYVLHERYLSLINLDVPKIPPIVTQSTFFIIQDENLDVQRLAVYNLGSEEEILKKFPFGTKFTIKNPYHRLARDGKPMIRVDDTSTIEILGYDQKACRTCGKGNCSSACSKCNVAFYCSKECQLNDWKSLKHNLICDRLKK